MKCHTNAISPTSGTSVSLWTATGHESQVWYLDNTSFFARQTTPIRPNKNRAHALNADRSYIGTICNVITSANNVYNDYYCTVQFFDSGAPATVAIRLPQRYNHYSPIFVTY